MERTAARPRDNFPLAWFQGIYYAVAGVWPILHIDSFMMVTGPKTDIWLVHTVGLLLVAVGVVLCLAAYRQRLTLEMIVLAAGAALALTAIELVYTWKGLFRWCISSMRPLRLCGSPAGCGWDIL